MIKKQINDARRPLPTAVAAIATTGVLKAQENEDVGLAVMENKKIYNSFIAVVPS